MVGDWVNDGSKVYGLAHGQSMVNSDDVLNSYKWGSGTISPPGHRQGELWENQLIPRAHGQAALCHRRTGTKGESAG